MGRDADTDAGGAAGADEVQDQVLDQGQEDDLLLDAFEEELAFGEEDAADQLGFVGLFLLQGKQRDANFYAKLLDVADYWQSGEQVQRQGADERHRHRLVVDPRRGRGNRQPLHEQQWRCRI